MSEGTGSVKTELLEEEHHQGWIVGRRGVDPLTKARATNPSMLFALEERRSRPAAGRRSGKP
jgi:hypothetical protein